MANFENFTTMFKILIFKFLNKKKTDGYLASKADGVKDIIDIPYSLTLEFYDGCRTLPRIRIRGQALHMLNMNSLEHLCCKYAKPPHGILVQEVGNIHARKSSSLIAFTPFRSLIMLMLECSYSPEF